MLPKSYNSRLFLVSKNLDERVKSYQIIDGKQMEWCVHLVTMDVGLNKELSEKLNSYPHANLFFYLFKDKIISEDDLHEPLKEISIEDTISLLWEYNDTTNDRCYLPFIRLLQSYLDDYREVLSDGKLLNDEELVILHYGISNSCLET